MKKVAKKGWCITAAVMAVSVIVCIFCFVQHGTKPAAHAYKREECARLHAAFPHTIKVKYTIDGKDYICRKWIGAGNKVPDKGTTIKVTYCEDKPSKARIEL